MKHTRKPRQSKRKPRGNTGKPTRLPRKPDTHAWKPKGFHQTPFGIYKSKTIGVGGPRAMLAGASVSEYYTYGFALRVHTGK